MVREFHELFNQPIGKRPRFVAKHALLRAALISEESAEVVTALSDGDIVEIAKELADVLYVVYGTAVTYGIDLDAVFTAVHAANLTKLDEYGKPIFREDGKVKKSNRYKAPDIAKVLGVIK